MGDVASKFMDRLVALYGELGTDDQDLVIEVYVKQLEGFDDEVLSQAFEKVAGSYMPSKRNPWPAPSICKKTCERVLADRKATQPQKPEPPKYPDWTQSAFAQADRLLVGPIAERAAREGWVLGLHDHYRKTPAPPSELEIRDMIANAQFVDRCAAGAVEMGKCHQALQNMANGFLAKREKLARRVLGTNF